MNINTLLIYAPSLYESEYPLLGIPQLIGYLNSKGYKNIYAKDLSMDKKLLNNIKENSKLKPQGNLNGILDTLEKYNIEKDYLYSLIKDLIINKNIEVLGFSIIYTYQLLYSLIIAKIAKEINPDIKILFGGYQVNLLVEKIIGNKNILNIIDFFVISYGEKPLEKILEQLTENKSEFQNIKNIYYKDSNQQIYIKTKEEGFVISNDIATPNFDDFREYFNNYKIKRLPIRSSIGCAWGKCSFCSFRLLDSNNNYYTGGIDRVIETITILKNKYNIKDFFFIDDQLSPQFIEGFVDKIISKNIDITWSCFIALFPRFSNETLAQKMKKSGCNRVLIGFESGSDKILKLMNKPHNVKTGEKIIKTFYKCNIKTTLSIMFGFPGETKKEAQKTMDFLINNFSFYNKVHIGLFEIYENTDIFNNPQKYGISNIRQNNHFRYKYDTKKGMNEGEALKFLYMTREKIKLLGEKNKLKTSKVEGII